MSDLEKRKKGVETFNKVYGEALQFVVPAPGASRSVDFMMESLFADLWSNEVLSFKERRLLLLGAIAAQGEDTTFKIHADAALYNGEITPEQLHEILIFLTQYVGYPRASKLTTVVNELAAKHGKK